MREYNDDEQDELMRQMQNPQEESAEAPVVSPPVNHTMAPPASGAAPLGAQDSPLSPPPNGAPQHTPTLGASAPAAAPKPNGLAAAQKSAAANGYTDIEGAGDLKSGDFVGSLEGFNSNAWGSGERGTNTLKNSFGKIASRYDPTQPGAAQSMMGDPDFQAMFPDAELQNPPKFDVIDFDGGGPQEPVDVITSATEGGGGRGWAWQPQGGGGAEAAGAAGANLFGADPLNDINAQLEALMNGQDPNAQNLVQQILRGEV